jgi:hypothetical protein
MSDVSDAHMATDEAVRLKAENERLRELIRAVVERVGLEQCPACGTQEKSQFHDRNCPWPALAAEAEK